MNYVYIQSEPNLWTTGFYDPAGKWQPDEDFSTPQSAANRVIILNGGKLPSPQSPVSLSEPAQPTSSKNKPLFYIGDKVKDLSGIEGTVVEILPHEKLIKVNFPGGGSMELNPDNLTHTTSLVESPEGLWVNEEENTVSKWIVKDKTGANVVWIDPDDETPQGTEIVEELVKRYNAYPELQKQVIEQSELYMNGRESIKTLQKQNYQLQEHNRVLVEALKDMCETFWASTKEIYLRDEFKRDYPEHSITKAENLLNSLTK